jgi:hypothetical protein
MSMGFPTQVRAPRNRGEGGTTAATVSLPEAYLFKLHFSSVFFSQDVRTTSTQSPTRALQNRSSQQAQLIVGTVEETRHAPFGRLSRAYPDTSTYGLIPLDWYCTVVRYILPGYFSLPYNYFLCRLRNLSRFPLTRGD